MHGRSAKPARIGLGSVANIWRVNTPPPLCGPGGIYYDVVSNLAAANVARTEVRRKENSTLEPAWNHRGVEEREDARVSDAIPTPHHLWPTWLGW